MSEESEEAKRERLLRLREKMKSKRPKFRRENYYRLKRIQTSWRSPKGIDSKMREKRRGKRPVPQTGYRGPKLTRGLHPSGFEVVQIFNTSDLDNVDPEYQIAQIGGSVGSRKRMKIIDTAEEWGIHIINPQIARLDFGEEEFVEEIEDEFELLEDTEFDDDLELLEDEDLEDEELLDEDFEDKEIEEGK